MMLSRLVLIAAAAAGVAYCLKGRPTTGLPWAPRQRLLFAGGGGGAIPASSPVAETMWTPSDPASGEPGGGPPSTLAAA